MNKGAVAYDVIKAIVKNMDVGKNASKGSDTQEDYFKARSLIFCWWWGIGSAKYCHTKIFYVKLLGITDRGISPSDASKVLIIGNTLSGFDPISEKRLLWNVNNNFWQTTLQLSYGHWKAIEVTSITFVFIALQHMRHLKFCNPNQ